MSAKSSSQSTLNVVGFMLLIMGFGLEGPESIFVIGVAILTFVVALVTAIFSRSGGEDEPADEA